jgi:hypothetical protein
VLISCCTTARDQAPKRSTPTLLVSYRFQPSRRSCQWPTRRTRLRLYPIVLERYSYKHQAMPICICGFGMLCCVHSSYSRVRLALTCEMRCARCLVRSWCCISGLYHAINLHHWRDYDKDPIAIPALETRVVRSRGCCGSRDLLIVGRSHTHTQW